MKRDGKRVLVLGGGISGLALGWFLREKYGYDIDLTILEKSDHVGGWIHTLDKDGFLFEQGPRSCRPKGPGMETLRLVEALGLEKEVIVGGASRRYIYRKGRLQRVPWAPGLLWPLIKGIAKDLWVKKGPPEDSSIASFFERRMGKEVATRLIDPLVTGIYAGDMHHLSLAACFPKFYQWEQEYGSLVKGAWRSREPSVPSTPFMKRICKYPLFSFRHGMETLTRALANELRNAVVTGAEVIQLKQQKKGVHVQLKDGSVLGGGSSFLYPSCRCIAVSVASRRW